MDAYLPCLKCKALIPQYVREIHSTECHLLKQNSFSHPLISGLSLQGQALICGTLNFSSKGKSSQNLSNNQAESKTTITTKIQKDINEKSQMRIEEPEWLRKIMPDFHFRIVVMNELDLVRCKITAYTSVMLEHVGHLNAFIAVPDSGIRIGHVMLHQIGCTKYFPSLTPNALILVKKINSVSFAKHIVLNPKMPLSEAECNTMETHIKSIMFSSYPLGSPYTVKINSPVYSYSSDTSCTHPLDVCNCYIQEQISTSGFSGDDQLIENFDNLHLQNNDESSTLAYETDVINEKSAGYLCGENLSRSWLSDSSFFDNVENVTLECIGGDSLKVSDNFLTSTPYKDCNNSVSNLHRYLLTSKFSGNVTLIDTSVEKDKCPTNKITQGINRWVRVGKNTRITVNHRNECSSSLITNGAGKKILYCRNNVYYSLIKIMQKKMNNHMASDADNPYLFGWNGVLLYGPPGTGKTHLVSEAACDVSVSLITLSLADVIRPSGGGSECVLNRFRLAIERAPSVLFIDEIDSLCPASEHRVSRDKDLTQAVISGIQLLKMSASPVLLIGATSRIEGVSLKLRCSGRLEKEILVSLPTSQQRSQILFNIISSHQHNLTEEDISQIARQAYGFSGADLNLLLKCAWFTSVQKKRDEKGQDTHFLLSKKDLQAGMAGVLPTILRQDLQAVALVRWSDIWGYKTLKSKLQRMIQSHLADPESCPLRGILLYGPPGCSKTMFVKVLVNETSFSFFPVKCSDLLSKYVGETEKSLSKIFECAQQVAPSIIFMDEVDSICGDRSDSSGLLSELLSLMSETTFRGNILVIGATNRPHVLDEALLKPGCLEQVYHVDLPDYGSRYDMWSGILKNVPVEGEISIGKLSEASSGYSGAEISEIYQHAAQSLFLQLGSGKEFHLHTVGDCSVVMNEDLILNSIAASPPRTPVSLLEKIKEFSNKRCSLSTGL